MFDWNYQTSFCNHCIVKLLLAQTIDNLSKEEGKDQQSIQSGTTPDLGHHIGN